MSTTELTIPSGSHDPWSTYSHQRTVLAVAHNVTAATRLLHAVPLLASDPRIGIVFTCPGSSVFDNDTATFLESQGVRQIPWQSAVSRAFDLAISASYGGDLHRIHAPLVVIPHGMGYNKYLETGNRKPETGNRKPETGNRFSDCRQNGSFTTAKCFLPR